MNKTKPIFDIAGNHMQTHGEPTLHCAVSTARRLGVLPALQVVSRAERKSTKAPEVLLFAAEPPFSFDWRMTPAAARVLAANLQQAADKADQVAAAQSTQRKAVKARKGGL